MIRLDRLLWIFFLASLNAFAYAGSLARNLKTINNTIPNLVSEVAHPYKHDELTARASSRLQLASYHKEANQIVDEEEWFDQYGLDYPEAIAPRVSGVPQSTRFGDLEYLRIDSNRYFAIYETVFMLEDPKDIYDEGHRYTLVVTDTSNDTLLAFDLGALFPDILEMCWFDAINDLVYFNATYNGYADIRDNKTGYLYCLDIEKGKVVWATRNLISSYCGFIIYKEYILTGYGFTAEPDFLYVIDRLNGDITQTIPIKTAHEHIVVKHDKCYVRTYDMNYIFKIIE